MGIQISLPMMAFLVFMTGFAGFVDSAAGGGGLISLPAYLFAGLPPHYTYATNKFSAACGTTFATASFFKNGAMNLKVGILAAIGSFAGSALGAHIVLMLSDEVLQMMMFIILPIAAVIILWRRNLPDENRDDGTLNLKKALLALGIGLGIGLYDGMVGPGTGTFAIIAFTSLMGFDLRTANGNAKVLNVIMLGVYVGYTEVIDPAIVWQSIEHKLSSKPKLLPLNKQAFEKGLELGRAQKQ